MVLICILYGSMILVCILNGGIMVLLSNNHMDTYT